MLSIDKAIAMLKFNNKHIADLENDDLQQLAEWLEELKSYRASVFSGDMTQKMLKEEYNKAIDDLLEDANEMAIEVDVDTYTMKAIGIGLLENIAEQLKVGGVNGKERS